MNSSRHVTGTLAAWLVALSLAACGGGGGGSDQGTDPSNGPDAMVGEDVTPWKVDLAITDPGQPWDPGTPHDPGGASDPGTPADPGKPTDPGQPSDPGSPSDPGTPNDPGQPFDPGFPSDPGTWKDTGYSDVNGYDVPWNDPGTGDYPAWDYGPSDIYWADHDWGSWDYGPSDVDWADYDWGSWDYGGWDYFEWEIVDWDFGAIPDTVWDFGPSECGNITDTGCCDGSVNFYCLSGILYEEDCDDYNAPCGWDEAFEYYGCFGNGTAPGNDPPIECP